MFNRSLDPSRAAGVEMPKLDETDPAAVDWASRTNVILGLQRLGQTPTAEAESTMDMSKPMGLTRRTGPPPAPIRPKRKIVEWR